MIDPTTLGLREPEWSANPPEKAERIINQYSKKVLRDLIAGGQQPPGPIVDRLIAFVIETTEPARSLLESSTRSPQTQLPGKMDHTTCLCLKISNLAELGPTRKSSSGHLPPLPPPRCRPHLRLPERQISHRAVQQRAPLRLRRHHRRLRPHPLPIRQRFPSGLPRRPLPLHQGH